MDDASPGDASSPSASGPHIVLPSQPGTPQSDIVNGGFEAGRLSPWQPCGGAAHVGIRTTAHTGSHAALSGTTSPPEVDGYAGICLHVIVPTQATLAFWVDEATNEHHTTYADQEADVLDAHGDVLDNLFLEATTTHGWEQRTFDLSRFAGRDVWLFFGVKGNGWDQGYINQRVDDVRWGSPAADTGTGSDTGTQGGAGADAGTGSWPCDDPQFLADQQDFANGNLYQDQFVDVCGDVTRVLDSRYTSSGLHGYFYVEVAPGDTIEIVSNLDEMNAPSWPWVSVGDYAYVQGRYYYDSAHTQGIDWTHDGTSSSWPHSGYVVVNGHKYN